MRARLAIVFRFAGRSVWVSLGSNVGGYEFQGCSASGGSEVGRGPKVLSPECLGDFGPVLFSNSFGGVGFDCADQHGNGHPWWVVDE